MHLHTVIITLATLLAWQAAAQIQQPYRWCRSFNQTGNYTNTYTDEYTHCISPGFSCNATTAESVGGNGSVCAIQYGGFFEQSRITNLTSAYDKTYNDTDYVYGGIFTVPAGDSAAYTIYNITGAYTVSVRHFGAVANDTIYLAPGISGYIAFGPSYRCISGRLDDCPADFDLNGTYVEVCEPDYTSGVADGIDGYGVYAGISYVVPVNETYAASLDDNPNATPPYGLLTGDAGVVEVGRTAMLIAGMAVLAVCL